MRPAAAGSTSPSACCSNGWTCSPRTAAAFIYLTIAGSLVAFACFSYALKHLDVAVVSLYTYVNPVIAVALGTLLLGEPFGMRMVVAAGVILVGMVVVGKR